MRLRVVQPAFWDDERIGEMSWDVRLLLVGLWSYVRDEGVGKDQLGQIIGTLFPYDSEKDHEGTRLRVTAALDELCAGGIIERFTAANVKYLAVVDWLDWQKPDKPSKRRFPSPTCADGEPPETPESVSRGGLETLAERSTEFGSRSSEVGVRKLDTETRSSEGECEGEPLNLEGAHESPHKGSRSAPADAVAPMAAKSMHGPSDLFGGPTYPIPCHLTVAGPTAEIVDVEVVKDEAVDRVECSVPACVRDATHEGECGRHCAMRLSRRKL